MSSTARTGRTASKREGGGGSRRKGKKLRSVALHVITPDIFPFSAGACTVREISLTMWKLTLAELRRKPCARSLSRPPRRRH